MKNNSATPLRPARSHQSGTPTLPALAEAPIWQSARADWRTLYGGFYTSGVSIEWHEFTPPHTFDWSRSFHPESLELCLNLEGDASIQTGTSAMRFLPRTAGFYLPGKDALTGRRLARQTHRFLTVEFSVAFLRTKLGSCDGALHPLVERFLRGEHKLSGLSDVLNLTSEHQQVVEQMLNPSVSQGARQLWYESKVLQLMADFFFSRPAVDELFCDRHKRLARERVSRTIALLEQHLEHPPSLEQIGKAVGCSPFYLSRTFSKETGLTIPQYLRKLRMERAAELLRSGKYNVTEAALQVGYNSLSHFSQAFCQTIGCCPALYPLGLKPGSPQPGCGSEA